MRQTEAHFLRQLHTIWLTILIILSFYRAVFCTKINKVLHDFYKQNFVYRCRNMTRIVPFTCSVNGTLNRSFVTSKSQHFPTPLRTDPMELNRSFVTSKSQHFPTPLRTFFMCSRCYELEHDNTNKMTYAPSKDSDQLGQTTQSDQSSMFY